ncbi:GNAT family N-acetyltransferase [Nonomuraea sp. NPDC050783]|uniref:GNAT family N-acetyltransferase n=1 Tax=Nonomuraea sp. NPDC050783 TaxID=3154634 RepID=UPI003467DAE0
MERDVVVRVAAAGEEAAVRGVLLAAFPTPLEADLVDALRADPAWIPALSRVAAYPIEGRIAGRGRVVAHALLTRCHIGDVPALALAPVAVVPAEQRRGLGTLVVEDALATARGLGERAVVVLGHPAYYPRFGFTPAARHGITAPFDAPADALMALSLDGTPPPRGVIRYAPPFGG